MVFAPIRYGFSWIERNVPLFLISMLAFGFICLLELIGFGIESIGFIFIIKLIELALLIAFIMQYDRIRCAAKAIANGDFHSRLIRQDSCCFQKAWRGFE